MLTACRAPWLAAHAGWLLKVALKVPPLRYIVRHTFAAQFTAGESDDDVARAAASLAASGIGAIYDYAAEPDDSEGDAAATLVAPAAAAAAAAGAAPPAAAVARTHCGGEPGADAAAATFKKAIAAAARTQNGTGFAAIKVTALGDPALLVRLSAAARAVDTLFDAFDADADGAITRPEFDAAYAAAFTDASPCRVDQLWRHLAGDEASITRRAWRARVRLADIPSIVPRCRSAGPLTAAAPTAAELAGLDALLGLLHSLADTAASQGVRLLVDAEHSAVQPAIAHAATELQRLHNVERASVYTTFQCYLRGADAAVAADISGAASEGWAWGAKLVRGAYLQSERARAAAAGVPSPCWDTKGETDACYDRAAAIAIEAVLAPGSKAEVMLATHNVASCAAAIARLPSLPEPRAVSFASLMGMSDGLAHALASRGASTYKYVPFGPLRDVLPYLARRAVENADAVAADAADASALGEELARRVVGGLLPRRVRAETGVKGVQDL